LETRTIEKMGRHRLEAAREDEDARADAADGRLRRLIDAHQSHDTESADRF
jgi:hypothetical protein